MKAKKDFYSEFIISTSGCWEWIGKKDSRGYGYFYFEGKHYRAHRLSYMLHLGSLPKREGVHGIVVMHSCDSPSCVNPAHLSLGTHKDNMRDMFKKKRRVEYKRDGDKNPNVKLSLLDVQNIRSEYLVVKSQLKLSMKYGVSQTHIGRIIRNEGWKQ